MQYRPTLSLPLLAVGCLFASSTVLAQTVNFTITGKINEASCTPTVVGMDANTVKLPTVQMEALDAPGKTAGDTPISFVLTGCAMSTAIKNMWVRFNSAGITAGRINTNNPNVKFEIRDVPPTGGMGNVVQVGGANGAQPTSTQGTAAPFTGNFPSRDAEKNYIIRYYANQAVTQAGDVSANATYTVKYF